MTKEYTSGVNIPSTRTSRAANLASLASSLAGSVITEGISQFSKGRRPHIKDLLLTPSNAKRVTEKLTKLRGAALKVGQLVSMDAGEFVPKELSDILARLRDDVDPMPFSQLISCLEEAWGDQWVDNFEQFSYSPIAAASIGQVHTAITSTGDKLALKIQYPNVGKSIDSDVDNVATLLRVSGLLPKQNNIDSLLEETKQQLIAETDYIQEASWVDFYREELKDISGIAVPDVHHNLTTKTILAMSYHEGVKVDQLHDLPQAERDRVVTVLMEVLLKEMFELKHVQTDPNMANFLYHHATGEITLLDFGAVRKLSDKVSKGYLSLMSASMRNDKKSINAACEQIGFFQTSISDSQRDMIINLFLSACEPLRCSQSYDFGASKLATEISQNAMHFSTEKNQWHTPPADALFLHRKIAGMYLIAAKLNARVNVANIFEKYRLH